MDVLDLGSTATFRLVVATVAGDERSGERKVRVRNPNWDDLEFGIQRVLLIAW